MITDIFSADEFEQKINTGSVYLVDFWAPWCGPCRMLSSIIDNIDSSGELDGSVGILKVNVDEAVDISGKFEIQSIPLLILFKDGVEIDRKAGFVPKSSLMRWLGENSVLP